MNTPRLQNAIALYQQGRLEEAATLCDGVLATTPQDFDALHLAGVIAYQRDNAARALELLDRARAVKPEHAQAHNTRGTVLLKLNRANDALAAFDAAIALKPTLAVAHSNRGLALNARGDRQDALASFTRAVALNPDLAEAWFNRAATLDEMGHTAEALESYDRTVALDPGAAKAWSNRGVLLADQGRGSEAVASFERCRALQPDNADVQWNLSLAYLQQGNFAQGWPLHEARWSAAQIGHEARRFGEREWRGEPLAGKTLLLHSDQGFGDAVQFIRYAKAARDLGARVIVEVRAPLVPLLQGMEGVDKVTARGDALPAFDLHCPLGSLPQVFGMNAENVPLAGGYLHAPEERVAQWGDLLGPRRKPRVGLAWTGNPTHRNNHNRSIALGDFVTVLSPGFEGVSLQKQLADGDRAILAAHPELRDTSATVGDFADTAALCTLMDVVVTVDTSVAHVAGALGVPVWILLPFNPDWRWMLGRTDTPWYASAKLYRQNTPGDWAGVLAQVRADLTRL